VFPKRRGQTQDIGGHQQERRKNEDLPKSAVGPFCGPIAIGGSDAKLQEEHQQEKSIGDVEKIKFVPGVRVGDGLRFLAGRKRVALHLPGCRWDGGRRLRGCGGLRLLRAARRGKEQAGRKQNEKRGEICGGLISSAVHLSSPDDAAPEKKGGRSARSMMQPAPRAQARRRAGTVLISFCFAESNLKLLLGGPTFRSDSQRRVSGAFRP